MPEVPYQPFATATPEATGEQIHVSPPPAAFGANVGAALQQLGTTTEQVGGELFQRALALQDLKNENDARDAQAEYAKQSALIQAGFDAKTGKDSADSLQAHIQSLQDLRKQIRGTLKTAYAQRYYDRDTMPFMQREIFSSAGRAGQQDKDYTIGTMYSQADLLQKQSGDHWEDPKLFDQNQQKIAQTVSQATQLKYGAPAGSPIVQDAVMKALSSHRAEWLLGESRTDPIAAMRDANKYKANGELTEPDFLRIQGQIEGKANSSAASSIVDRYFQQHMQQDGTLDVSVSQAQKEIRDLADKAGISPALANTAIGHFDGRINQLRYGGRIDKTEATNSLVDTILKNNITDAQQLMAFPGADKQIEKMDPKIRANAGTLQNWINSINDSAHKTTNQEYLARANGMSNNDVQKFLETDFTTWPLNRVDMIKLQAKQGQLAQKASSDPRVETAMRELRGARGGEIESLGVFKRTEQNADDYDHFTGALQEALQEWQEDKGKPPTYQEKIDIIGPQLIKRQIDQKGWFGGYKDPAFKHWTRPELTDIPSTFIQSLTQKLTEQGNDAPTDQEILKAYRRATFQMLYGGISGPGK